MLSDFLASSKYLPGTNEARIDSPIKGSWLPNKGTCASREGSLARDPVRVTWAGDEAAAEKGVWEKLPVVGETALHSAGTDLPEPLSNTGGRTRKVTKACEKTVSVTFHLFSMGIKEISLLQPR